MDVFGYFQDPGHGWVKVPKALLSDLGIAGEISSYSYVKGEDAYLEEDCDAPRFLRAYRERFGSEPELAELYQPTSPIRNYARYA